ncbi:sodium:hydrogen antiporter [Niabella soli DSM 19437]|uniref:Sodium:hydrogen antiporter n=2 Tax=Niabella TaxID=379899 RepID=W0EXJ6_9BACT|nr:sodium:hydrogen antiporter [Niabella soli DSM 19437]
MLHHLPFYLLLIVFIMLLVMLAKRINVAYPIILVLGGLAISLIPAMPVVEINHELIFFVFLPPLLYEAAWQTSWKEFWRFRRIISSFAFLIVILTSLVVAWVASSFIPGFSLALGFLLGGIVSPPDAVSASAIMKSVKVPKALEAIIEGESLLNDASSLIVFRFALVAVETGSFVFRDAAFSFFWVILAGIAIGLAVGFLFYLLHRWLPTDVNIDLVFTLVAPYAMYLAAESLHVSGVLAVVSGGLFLSTHQHRIMNSSSRLRVTSVWSALGFVLNGLVFMLIGLALPSIANGLGDVSMNEAIGYGVLITGVLIVGRLLSAYGAIGFTLFISRYIRTAGAPRNWKAPFIFGWSGMRGVVSLAAALSIPAVLTGTTIPFPQRNLILFITFIVILLTLIVQGLTMPWFIKVLRLEDPDHHPAYEEERKMISQRLASNSLSYMREHYADELTAQPALQKISQIWESKKEFTGNEQLNVVCRNVYLEVINKQRDWLHEWNKDLKTNEEIIRGQLMQLDLEEEKLKLS